MFFVIGFEQRNVAWLCILEAAIETCPVKRSDVIFCKKLGTKKKETPKGKTDSFIKTISKPDYLILFQLGFLIFAKDFKEWEEYNLKLEHWDDAQESEGKQKLLAYEKNMF